jgi:peptide/nickel transport system substrate-binding protein
MPRPFLTLLLCLALAPCAAAPPAVADEGATSADPHRGGTLRLVAHAGAGSIDPQVNDTAQYWQVFAVSYDGLLTYRKAEGADGLALVPDLADALPAVSADGLRYEFRLRHGVRFSDGRPVRASDAAASLRRAFRVAGPGAGFLAAIEGAQACTAEPDTCRLEGVEGDDATGRLTLRLARPDTQLAAKLALPPASVLPADTPPHDAGLLPPPGTGPYRIEGYDPGRGLRLVRNPAFRPWSLDAQPDGHLDAIDYEFGLDEEAAITAIENGQADWTFDQPPFDRLPELGARYAALVHLHQTDAIWFMALNTREAPFDDPRVRRAVALAVDRDAAALVYGGPRMGLAWCTMLPPILPGSEPGCATGHDPEEARRLVREAGALGARVTLVADQSSVQRQLGTYLQSVMASIGLDARLSTLSGDIQFTYIQNSANHVQASLSPWYADFPDASDFLDVLASCGAFHPGSDSSLNMSGFCDPAIDVAMREAEAATGADAAARWAAIDRRVMERSPMVVVLVPSYVDVVAARVHGYAYTPLYHMLLSALWLR